MYIVSLVLNVFYGPAKGYSHEHYTYTSLYTAVQAWAIDITGWDHDTWTAIPAPRLVPSSLLWKRK